MIPEVLGPLQAGLIFLVVAWFESDYPGRRFTKIHETRVRV